MKIQFKHEFWGKDWQDWPASVFDEEMAAHDIAQSYWQDDPSDPTDFNFEIEIKSGNGIKKFTVTAEPDVHFYVREKGGMMENGYTIMELVVLLGLVSTLVLVGYLGCVIVHFISKLW